MSSINLCAPFRVRIIFGNFPAVKSQKEWGHVQLWLGRHIYSCFYFRGSSYIIDFFVIPSFHSHFLHATSFSLFMCALAPLRCHFPPLCETDGPIAEGGTWGHESFAPRNIFVCPTFCWARGFGWGHEWRLKAGRLNSKFYDRLPSQKGSLIKGFLLLEVAAPV
jgi:hypothetical protein